MGQTILISLVSDQTIPNVQLIKQLKEQIAKHLFVTTSAMEQKGIRSWIETACDISTDVIVVDEFSFADINSRLHEYDFEKYDKIIVNLTGGTKIMTLVAYDFFKNLGADIYYVTGQNNSYIKVFPSEKNNVNTFTSPATLHEYLTAYGFTIKRSTPSGVPFEQTEKIFKSLCSIDVAEHVEALRFIVSKRDKTINNEDFDRVANFLSAIGYTPEVCGCLSKAETKYLSGDWFEEYVGLKIKHELNLSDENIFIGTELIKALSQKVKNSPYDLLGEVSDNETDNRNEMDVMFIHNNKFYSIECKSSIVAYRTIMLNGEYVDKPYNILGETIYKSDSLAKRFGLYANTAIVTLSDFAAYCADDEVGKHKTKIKQMEGYINRANLSNIKLIDKRLLMSSDSLFDLLK